jgi:hypothetical protein
MTAIAIWEVLNSVNEMVVTPTFALWRHHQNFYSGQLTLSANKTTLIETGYARQKPQNNQLNLVLCYVWDSRLSICLSVYLSICTSVRPSTFLPTYLWLYSPCGPWPIFQFLNPHRVGRTSWTGDQPVARPLPTHTTQTQNKRIQTSMPWVGFEHTTPVLQRAKTVHALDSAATVIGVSQSCSSAIMF